MLDTSAVDAIDPFTRSGLTPEQLRDFFSKAAKAGRKTTPTTESGNVYAVSKAFHALNGPLVVDEYLNKLHALDASDLQRARAFVETVALDAELRNRNPLHPSATRVDLAIDATSASKSLSTSRNSYFGSPTPATRRTPRSGEFIDLCPCRLISKFEDVVNGLRCP